MSPIGPQLLLQGALILINAFFAATEIALLSLNEGKLKKQAEDGDRTAACLLRMADEPTGFLSTIQIGITLAGFLGSAFAADNFSDRLVRWLVDSLGVTAIPEKTLDTLAVIAITLILSYFTLILGELVPKRVAMKKSETVARAVCGVIRVLSLILKPIIWFMTVSTNLVLRLFGINPHEEQETDSEEEIIMMLDIGEENGTIEPEEKELIENVFAFNDVTAADVMVHRTRATFIWLDDSPEEIIRVITDTGYSRIPVCRETIDDVVGILYTREYLLTLQINEPRDPKKLLHPVKFVPESMPAHDLLKEMQRERMHMAMVVDEFGGVAGIVTMEDILEELVGEIWDESDEVIEELVQTSEDSYRALGDMNLDDMLSHFDYEAEDDVDSVSVSGWVSEQLGHIPDPGESFTYKTLRIEVLKTDQKQVLEVSITVVPASEEEDEADEE
ncbi:MAG: HlyC/CorC family transporter [Ruminococcaceae bacterium]|nr:HlyC/CorC family transporter [Oscillospiraceae bacterium]